MELHGLLQQQPDGGATGHAVTTPSIQPLQLVLAQAHWCWMG
jgi:hypothetical protein